MLKTVLRTKGVTSGYGKLQIINGIDIELKKGELVTIIGPNGCGKSTLIKTIMGLIPAWEGEILINESINIAGMKPSQIVKGKIPINYVPQVSNVFPTLSVQENLKIGSLPRDKSSKEKIQSDLNEIFEIFPRLKERLNQKAALLSGGERQMLALSRALMSSPEILLLDEPTAALAPVLADEIFEKILELNQRGLSILLVEQRATRALSISNRAYVLVTGEIAYTGTGQALLDDAKVGELYLGKKITNE